jgi:glycosyltransferase involved in cell wall biosynthesis
VAGRLPASLRRRLRGGSPAPLVILDDLFPHPLSPFRLAEFEACLHAYPDAVVHSTATNFVAFAEPRSFAQVLAAYEAEHPRLRGRTLAFHAERALAGSVASFIFLHNAATFLPVLERDGVPFTFTLYPGGGLKLDQPETDAMLRRVGESPQLRRVIATQRIIRDYVVDHGFIDAARVDLVYGGVFPVDRLVAARPPRRRYGRDKQTFDICFVGHRYTPQGRDKGYDVFVAMVRELSRRAAEARFHVVGPFDAADVDITGLEGVLSFRGSQPTGFFPDFYAGMDVIVAPSVPFVRAPGAFDGFPTGTCIEAGACGTVVVATDPLDLNVALDDGREVLIVPHDAGAIAETVDGLRRDPGRLAAISAQGEAAFRRIFDTGAQMAPRLRVLDELRRRR